MSSILLGAVETPKSGCHAMVTLRQLEVLGDEEIPGVTGEGQTEGQNLKLAEALD